MDEEMFINCKKCGTATRKWCTKNEICFTCICKEHGFEVYYQRV